MDLRRLFGDLRGHWMVGVAVALFAVLVGIGVAVGHSASGPGAGPTGASGPSGRSEKRRLEHRKLADGSPRQRKQTTVPDVVGDQEQARRRRSTSPWTYCLARWSRPAAATRDRSPNAIRRTWRSTLFRASPLPP